MRPTPVLPSYAALRNFAAVLAVANIVAGAMLLWVVRDLYLPAGMVHDASGMFIGRDFVNLWVGAHAFASGNTDLLFNTDRYLAYIHHLFGTDGGEYIWSYPPHIGLLLEPLRHLPYSAALLVFETLSLLLLLCICVPQAPDRWRPLLLLLLLTSPVVLPVLYMGQNGFLSAACIIGVMLWRKRRPLAAGLLLALLTFKPQLGVAAGLALLALGAWGTIICATVITAAWVGYSVIAYGPDVWLHYFQATLPHHAQLFEIYADSYFMVSPAGNFLQWNLGKDLAMGLHLAVMALVCGLLCWLVRRVQRPEQQALLVATATFLLSPYAQGHDMAAVNAALALCLLASPERGAQLLQQPGFILAFGLLWLMPAFVVPFTFVGVYLCAPLLFGAFLFMAFTLARQER